MSRAWRNSLFLLAVGAISGGRAAVADAPCCNSCNKSCCPAVQKIKIKRNVGIGAGEPPRYYSTAVSRAAILTEAPAVRFVLHTEDQSRSASRDVEYVRERSSDRSSCGGSSDDTRRIIEKMEKLTEETAELAKVVDHLAERVIEIEKQVVAVKEVQEKAGKN
jgi:hypothetical protein